LEVDSEVVIIGGGITGLTAAYEVVRRGGRPIVYEASARSGGLIRTEQVDGLTIEAGPDSVLASKPAALDLIRELGLESDVQGVRPPGGAFVLRDGTLYRLPQPSFLGIPLSREALDAYDLLPPEARDRMAAEPDVPPRAPGGDESVGAFFRRRFGPETVDLIAQPLLGGIHAGDIEQLSMRSLFPRLLDLEREHGSVMRAPIAASTAGGPAEPRGFASLRGGMGSLVRALEGALPAGTIRRGSPVATLADVRTATQAVIVAAPAFAAARIIEPLDADAARLCARVPYVSTASVALAWPRALVPHPLDGTGFVVARRHSAARITACTWVSSKWEGRAPDGTALLRAFIGGAHDPDAASLPEAELVEIVRRDLAAVLGVAAEPSVARVYRWPGAGAQHLVGHLERVEEIERRLRPHGVIVAGSGFRAVGIPDCIADARRAAGEAIG
jgi:protoporphyrinogen/coproporphyrinogen III oxidase